MPMKEPQRQVYRTARGAELDMGRLINQNELAIAVGNAGVNARGDKLGPGGKIVKRREEIIAEQTLIPDQVNVRQPAPEIKVAPAKASNKKDISDMDPEGNDA